MALKVMSTVRNVLLVAHSAVFRGEAVTGREITGYVLILDCHCTPSSWICFKIYL